MIATLDELRGIQNALIVQQVNEEDYDPAQTEELQLRRARPPLDNPEVQPLLTVALIPQPKAYKSSKMLVNAVESGDLDRLPPAGSMEPT